MYVHNGMIFHDENMRPLGLTRRAIRNYYANECEIAVVTGLPEGVGKSAWCNHGIAGAMGFLGCHDKAMLKYMYEPNTTHTPETPLWEADYEGAKPYILYQPEDMVQFLMQRLIKHEKVPIACWDDGGTFLHSMSFADPFVVAFMQFLPSARSVTGLVVISTPVEDGC